MGKDKTQLSKSALQVNVVCEMEAIVLTPSISRPVDCVFVFLKSLHWRLA